MFRQDIIAEFNQQRRITVNENQQADYLYLECHVTFEPVIDSRHSDALNLGVERH